METTDLQQGTLLTAEDKSWKEFWLKSKQEEILRLEETAKYMTGLIAILITIFQLNSDLFKDTSNNNWVAVGIAAWLLSLVSSIFVLFPKPYGYHPNFTSEIPTIFEKIVSFKRRVLFLSFFCFAVGIADFSINFWQYRSLPEKKKEETKYIIIQKDTLTQNLILKIQSNTIQK